MGDEDQDGDADDGVDPVNATDGNDQDADADVAQDAHIANPAGGPVGDAGDEDPDVEADAVDAALIAHAAGDDDHDDGADDAADDGANGADGGDTVTAAAVADPGATSRPTDQAAVTPATQVPADEGAGDDVDGDVADDTNDDDEPVQTLVTAAGAKPEQGAVVTAAAGPPGDEAGDAADPAGDQHGPDDAEDAQAPGAGSPPGAALARAHDSTTNPGADPTVTAKPGTVAGAGEQVAAKPDATGPQDDKDNDPAGGADKDEDADVEEGDDTDVDAAAGDGVQADADDTDDAVDPDADPEDAPGTHTGHEAQELDGQHDPEEEVRHDGHGLDDDGEGDDEDDEDVEDAADAAATGFTTAGTDDNTAANTGDDAGATDGVDAHTPGGAAVSGAPAHAQVDRQAGDVKPADNAAAAALAAKFGDAEDGEEGQDGDQADAQVDPAVVAAAKGAAADGDGEEDGDDDGAEDGADANGDDTDGDQGGDEDGDEDADTDPEDAAADQDAADAADAPMEVDAEAAALDPDGHLVHRPRGDEEEPATSLKAAAAVSEHTNTEDPTAGPSGTQTAVTSAMTAVSAVAGQSVQWAMRDEVVMYTGSAAFVLFLVAGFLVGRRVVGWRQRMKRTSDGGYVPVAPADKGGPGSNGGVGLSGGRQASVGRPGTPGAWDEWSDSDAGAWDAAESGKARGGAEQHYAALARYRTNTHVSQGGALGSNGTEYAGVSPRMSNMGSVRTGTSLSPVSNATHGSRTVPGSPQWSQVAEPAARGARTHRDGFKKAVLGANKAKLDDW